jgi:hypothetical protein
MKYHMAKTIEIESEDLGTAIRKYGVAQETALALRQHFEPFEKKALEWKEQAEKIFVTDASQVKEMRQAREARLALKAMRGEVTAKHKELKEDALRKGQVLDTIKRKLVGLIEPIEEHLDRQERFVEIQEEQRRKALHERRVELLIPYMGPEADSMPLADMSQDAFDNFLEGLKEAKARRERQAWEEEERRKAEEDDQRRRDDEAQKKIEDQRRRIDRSQRMSTLGMTWNVEAQRYELGDLYVTSEQVFETSAAGFKAVFEETEKVVRALREKKRLEEQRLQDELRKKREEEERKKREERKAKRAPDKVKLLAFAEQIRALKCPPLKDVEALAVADAVTNRLNEIVALIKRNVDKL